MAASSYIIGGIEDRRLLERHATPEYTPGQLASTNGKLYKYCKYNQGAGSVAGVQRGVAYYYAPGGVATTGYADTEVTHDLSDSIEIGAGVLQAALADGEYGWMQVAGFAQLAVALTGPPGDGAPLTPTGASDGSLAARAAAAADNEVCAYAFDVSQSTIICNFVQ